MVPVGAVPALRYPPAGVHQSLGLKTAQRFSSPRRPRHITASEAIRHHFAAQRRNITLRHCRKTSLAPRFREAPFLSYIAALGRQLYSALRRSYIAALGRQLYSTLRVELYSALRAAVIFCLTAELYCRLAAAVIFRPAGGDITTQKPPCGGFSVIPLPDRSPWDLRARRTFCPCAGWASSPDGARRTPERRWEAGSAGTEARPG